ncbi:MAG: hypothetical protein WB609_10335 [Candidatus Cybelea sp.]
MKAPHRRPGRLIVAVASAIIIAGCSSAQAPISPTGSSANMSRYGGPLTGASTEVDIQNNWIAAIAGSGSSDCWTISPGLPIVGAGDTAGPITLTHTTSPSCGIPSGLAITYGPAAATAEKCTFNTVYNASGFTFSVTQTQNTACTIKYPPNGVNAIFDYAQGT